MDFNPQMVARQVGVTQHRNNSDAQSKQDFVSRPYVVHGQFLMENAGELLRDLSFPIMFIEKPLFTFGGALEDNQAIEDGNFPTVSAVVVRWNVELRGDQTYLYRGCSLAAVTTGVSDQRMWINWNFTGIGLTNPTGGISTVGGAV